MPLDACRKLSILVARMNHWTKPLRSTCSPHPCRGCSRPRPRNTTIAAGWHGKRFFSRVAGPCAALLVACGTYTQDELGSRHTTPNSATVGSSIAAVTPPGSAPPSSAASNSTAPHRIATAQTELAVPTTHTASASRHLTLVPGRKSVPASNGMVVSVNAEATRIGVKILEQGGNAVDAAVAVALALAVTHPSAGNLGGGGLRSFTSRQVRSLLSIFERRHLAL